MVRNMSVYLRLRLSSQLSFIQYMGLCVFRLPNSPVMIVIMCALSYYHHQIVWIINHCLGLGHETLVCAVCLTMFLCYVLGSLATDVINTMVHGLLTIRFLVIFVQTGSIWWKVIIRIVFKITVGKLHNVSQQKAASATSAWRNNIKQEK